MAEHTCFNCSYCICDPCLWLSLMAHDEPILPRCANHPLWPGQLHDVPGVPCRNYHPRPTLPEGDNIRWIALTDGSYAYVDAADYEQLSQWKWHLEDNYPTRTERGKDIPMHRQIMQPPPGKVVDHKDGNRAHNCRGNLRICDRAENNRNHRKRCDSSSAYKGIFYDKHYGRWGAKCQYQGERLRFGYFDTPIEAARAYDRKAVELFGPFARLNFPQEWPLERRAQLHAEWLEKQGKNKKEKVKRKKGRGGKAKSGGDKATGKGDRAKSESKKVKRKSVEPRRARRTQRGLAALGRNQKRCSHKDTETQRKPARK
jgi:hypothetical protein